MCACTCKSFNNIYLIICWCYFSLFRLYATESALDWTKEKSHSSKLTLNFIKYFQRRINTVCQTTSLSRSVWWASTAEDKIYDIIIFIFVKWSSLLAEIIAFLICSFRNYSPVLCSIEELVKDDENGLLFDNSNQLADHLQVSFLECIIKYAFISKTLNFTQFLSTIHLHLK